MEITVKVQMQIANEVLVKIKRVIDNEAIIAGGAPRNWDEGKLANDIDLYMRSFNHGTKAKIATQVKTCLGVENLELYQDTDAMQHYTCGTDLNIVRLFGFILNGVKFQLIIMNPNHHYTNFKSEVVKHMDIGLNRISCDWYSQYETSFNKTSEYVEDRRSHTLTLLTSSMSKDQLEHCMKVHLPKMQSYYPDYKLVIK